MKRWEDLCSNCGLCCREKVVTEDFLIFLDGRCQFYDEGRKRCSVYAERFSKCRRCMKVNIFRACFADYLPPSCAYVQWAKKHHIRFTKDKECVFEN